MVLMDAEGVRQLARIGETYTVEFKRSTRAHPLNDRDLVEAVVCLANGDGGYLLLGVEDDGRITGAAPRHGDETHAHLLRALIVNQTDPSVATSVEVVDVDVDNHPVVVIDVPNMPTPVGTTTGVYKRRSTKADGTPECVPYRPHEMMTATFSLTGRDYAEVPARGATLDDLDDREFDRLRQLCSTTRGDTVLATASNLEICRALRVVRPDGSVPDQPTLGAVLLFGTAQALAEHVPTAECLFQVFEQDAMSSNETIRAPLFKTAEDLFARVDARNDEEEVLVGLLRVAVPRVPRATMREAIANALVHRDYAELGPITVQLTSDEFRVTSPGGFPPGVMLSNLLEQSRPRSIVLADAFKRAGIVDRAGRGVPEMFSALLRLGRDVPDYSSSTDRSVTVSIPTTGADLDLVRFVVAYEDQNAGRLSVVQLRILHELKSSGAEAPQELADALGLGLASLRPHLARLVESGLLEARGVGRNRRYHLSAGFYRLAQDKNAYVRLAAAEPIQQEQMVLSYVDRYGRITRSEVATLCMVTPDQARQILQRLVRAGSLELRGERRGAHYVRARCSG